MVAGGALDAVELKELPLSVLLVHLFCFRIWEIVVAPTEPARANLALQCP